jgi:hypothetical protein
MNRLNKQNSNPGGVSVNKSTSTFKLTSTGGNQEFTTDSRVSNRILGINAYNTSSYQNTSSAPQSSYMNS